MSSFYNKFCKVPLTDICFRDFHTFQKLAFLFLFHRNFWCYIQPSASVHHLPVTLGFISILPIEIKSPNRRPGIDKSIIWPRENKYTICRGPSEMFRGRPRSSHDCEGWTDWGAVYNFIPNNMVLVFFCCSRNFWIKSSTITFTWHVNDFHAPTTLTCSCFCVPI